METIKGHPEHVEGVFGEAIVARDEALVVLSSACGLGPPDLCWLQKSPKSALTGASGEAKGYYHYCLGVNTSSSAAVAAYFATLTSMVEAPTFLQGLFSTTETRIERGFYCCYDPLSRLDVRCELCIPGGVVCGALDAEGNVHDVTPDLWRNCVVATFLRSELYDAELVSYSRAPVARHPSLPSHADESRLLTAVLGLYEDGVLPEALDALTIDQACGVAPEHADVVLHALLHYFSKRQRWGTALEFFARLSVVYPAAALYVAAVQRECGLYDEALSTLSRAVDDTPDEPLLLAALATECLYADQLEASLRFATRAVRIRPLLRPGWLALARAHVRLGGGGGPGGGSAAALVVLNLVPPPPLPGREDAMLHVVVPPDPKATTRPAAPAFDLDVSLARQVLAEEAVVHPGVDNSGAGASSAPATTLPGALMVPREPPEAAACPDTSPLRITKAVLAAVYTVLQELVAVSGWDGFLQLRSAVFVMHADSDVLKEQQREAEEREQQLRALHRQLSATLPTAPGKGGALLGPAPPLQPGPPHRRPPPEGLNYEQTLDEAVAMGLADYPEHLAQAGYDEARIAAAREANRRHLRSIAERQAALEAAEAGDEADDEGGGSDEGGGGGGGGRGRRGGRRAQQQQQQQQQAAAAQLVADEEEEALAAAAGAAAVAAAAPPPPGDMGIVDAAAMVREEQQAAADEENAAAAAAAARQAAAAAQAVAAEAEAPAKPAAPASTSWWGGMFGGGSAQAREPGPLGEATEAAGGGGSACSLDAAALSFRPGPGVVALHLGAEERWWEPAAAPVATGRLGGAGGGPATSAGVVCSPLAPLQRGRSLHAPSALPLPPAQCQTGVLGSATESTVKAVGGGGGGSQKRLAAAARALALRLLTRLAAPSRPGTCSGKGQGQRQRELLQRRRRRSGPAAGALLAAALAPSPYGPCGPLLSASKPRAAISPAAAGPGPVAESGGDGSAAATGPPAAAAGAAAAAAAGAAGSQLTMPSAHDAAAAAAALAAAGGGGGSFPGGEPAPLVLQNHDADRGMVMEGLDVVELGAKRLCVRWLDELIVALWHDLQAFLDWKALDSELGDAGFGSHADIVAGIAPGPTQGDMERRRSSGSGAGSAPPPPPLPALPATEWLRRGLLAERLHHEADALAAYQAAVMTPPSAGGGGSPPAFAALPAGGPGAFSAIAWQAVMRLAPAAEPRDTAWALRGVSAVIAWLEQRAGGAVPFTSGYLPPASATAPAATPSAGGGGGGGRAATAVGGRLAACPLTAVQCLHLVAAVLGEEGVEAALAASGRSGGGGAAPSAVPPVAAMVLRNAVAAAVAARAAAAAAAGVAPPSPRAGVSDGAAASPPPGRVRQSTDGGGAS
ncbi:hypothetical protein HYH03_014321 [Edaphochlamys debaryana]|uniref:Uncharacterized protein n=1 Tax=Edaphochlamys debaryana TaxID=47281 RepID=A0A836BSB5_9CHLO|nr:hypothetical protein HYH03_014321 [Edaphochlamys debaryana]|eukprot:KAG2487075.1 hypothetical protein HYH03_014321 [Edaphochlamys debaryana]